MTLTLTRCNHFDKTDCDPFEGGCSAQVGRVGGAQRLNLGSGCFHRYIVTHELVHSIGFWHEQSRSDRDDWVQINWNNIREGMWDTYRSVLFSGCSKATEITFWVFPEQTSVTTLTNSRPTPLTPSGGAMTTKVWCIMVASILHWIERFRRSYQRILSSSPECWATGTALRRGMPIRLITCTKACALRGPNRMSPVLFKSPEFTRGQLSRFVPKFP